MDDWTDLGNSMIAIADALCVCLAETPNGEPDYCGPYWNAPPDDTVCDCSNNGQLIIWLERLWPSVSLPSELGTIIRRGVAVSTVASLAVRLIRPCWPTLKDSQADPFPSRAETEIPTLNLAIDASAVMCCLLAAITPGDGNVLANGCLGARMGSLTPDRNRAGCSGLVARFDLVLGTCCTPIDVS